MLSGPRVRGCIFFSRCKLQLRAVLIDHFSKFPITTEHHCQGCSVVHVFPSEPKHFHNVHTHFHQVLASLPNLQACLREVGLRLKSVLSNTNSSKSLIKSN